MAGSRPHQTSPHHAESANVHQQGELHDLEREKDMETSRKAACRRFIQVEVVIEEEVMQYMSKLMKKLCNKKSMI